MLIKLKNKSFNGVRAQIALVVIIFSILGTAIILASNALSYVPTVQVEPEQGVVSSPASVVDADPTASASSYIKFGIPAGGLGVTASGANLIKAGSPFIPKGFNMVALAAPIGTGCNPGIPRNAKTAWERSGNPELNLIKNTWKADTLRFQVSQPGLDPNDNTLAITSAQKAAYLSRLQDGVSQALNAGMTVILSMQDQSPACGKSHALPTQATLRAWQTLAGIYKNSPNVLFELFNEPHVQPSNLTDKKILPTDQEIHTYLWGASAQDVLDSDCYTNPDNNTTACLGADNNEEDAEGINPIIAAIRSAGANNLVVVDGSPVARVDVLFNRTDSNDKVVDPANNVAYAVHPYYFHVGDGSSLSTDTALWDTKFGTSASAVPIIATEWDLRAAAECYAGANSRAPVFLDYLRNKKIGITAHAFDVPNTMNTMGDATDSSTWTPTDSSPWTSCSPAPASGMDAGGDIIKAKYLTW